MRTAISPGQWQPWTAVSTVGQKIGLKAVCILLFTAEAGTKRQFHTSSVKGRMQRAFSPTFCPTAETGVHGCHCSGDMAVCMRKILARPWVGVRLSLAFTVVLHFSVEFGRSLDLLSEPGLRTCSS